MVINLIKSIPCNGDVLQEFELCTNTRIKNRLAVTARTNASEPKLERLLYYENTKLGKRRRGTEVPFKSLCRQAGLPPSRPTAKAEKQDSAGRILPCYQVFH